MSRRLKEIPTKIESDEEVTAPGADQAAMTSRPGVVQGWAMKHDGKYGYVVYELELPMSIIERYCTKTHSPDIKAGAISRIEHVALRVTQEGITKPQLSGSLFEDD